MLRGIAGSGLRVLAVVLVSGPLIASGAAAEQQPGLDLPPHPGSFLRAAPLYAESVDGWRCHFLGDCRSETRNQSDPSPVAWAPAGEEVQISCRFGNYLLLSTPTESSVWAPGSAVTSDYRQVDCSPPDWW